MKKLDVILDALLYAFYMFAACLVMMVAEAGIIRVLTLCFEIDYFVLCVIRAVIYTVGVNVILSLTAYREGYKAAQASVIGTLISGVIATCLHFMLCLLFSFEAFCAGGVKFITAIVKFGPSLSDSSFIGQLYRIDFFAVFFVNSLVYCVLMAAFKKIGAQKRLVDRQELTRDQSEDL
ncbi:MAG: hypothetical protein IJY39_05865 [Clostridia bacterium]|nr:hypothetical protein [Clostridia bacterium]